jgi:SNF2 family DNA or RNA helicase
MACFNEQRTGKTPTSLAACYLKDRKKIVIVCPASAVIPWITAYKYWYEQPCEACIGTAVQQRKALAFWQSGLVISYGVLKHTLKHNGFVDAILAQNPDAVIIDEGHRIQDRRSAQSRAIFKLSKIPYRLLLSGTPIPNKSYTIWSILHFLYPNKFTSFWNFIYKHYETRKAYRPGGQTFVDIQHIKPKSEIWLQKTLDMISTCRKRKDVMPWLPAKDYQRITLPLTTLQKKYLKELETYYETGHIVTQTTLDRLIRYRQVCIAPELLELRGTSPKKDWVLEYIKDYPDTPSLIVSKFTSFIHILSAALPDVPLIVGATPLKERDRIVKMFQEGKYNFILMNMDACKESLTLDRAEAIIFIDKFPPVGDIAQMEDRFVATTEDRANKPHIIYELVMEDSYEEELMLLIESRKTESDIVNNYKEYIERRRMNGTSSSKLPQS